MAEFVKLNEIGHNSLNSKPIVMILDLFWWGYSH